jgi:hypothetical protein
MPKVWSKPFLHILNENSDAWRDASDKSEHLVVVDTVANRIKAKLSDDGDTLDVSDALLNSVCNNYC